MSGIQYQAHDKRIEDLALLFERGKLNLSPGFQRDSVWSTKDREKLIDSILRNWPMPAIFLYKRHRDDGEIVYDVIDGKQRLETILFFVGAKRGNRFSAKVQLPDHDSPVVVDWNSLKRERRQHAVTGYRISTIEVDGEFGDIVDLFVRINSTGKALSSAERRHAKFFNSVFLKEADKLATRWRGFLREEKILSAGQIGRMKHVELICELLVSVHQGDVLNKKAVLDKVMDGKEITAARTAKASAKLTRTLRIVQEMFPELRSTRFHHLSDFYSLVVLVSKFDSEGLILGDKQRNLHAQALLKSLSTGVDELRERQKKLGGAQEGEEIYREYLLTVLEGTDELTKRRRREHLLRGLLETLFSRKDGERIFSQEQRRILWNTSDDRLCAICGAPVLWADLQIDHVNPFSRGGRTALENAALAHGKCNARKGAR